MLSQYLTVKDNKFTDDFTSDYNFGFEVDHFQKHAITSINNGDNILITAHTGSGKTVPAIYGIHHSQKKGKKILYTSPIKSLSNQKYQELSQKFDSVGILTGDIKFNPDAQCVILTTEILRNMLYKKTDDGLSLDDVDKIIFDEIHYINDPHRGKVWEETLILLPPRIQLIMLSATIDKAEQFASWIGDLKKVPIALIPTDKRVVPLEHNVYNPNGLLPENKLITFIGGNCSEKNKVFKNYNQIQETYKKENLYVILPKFIEYLKEKNYLPTLFFVFSRKETEKMAHKTTINLITDEERAEIKKIFNYNMAKYKDTYEKLPQYQDILSIIQKGVAYHHSGLIPILKEVIEILFGKGLIKVLYATETFAVGVNMPTKVVVFPRLSKFTDGRVRHLRTDEYLQMAGRAGRRGIDKFGKVIILPTDDLLSYEQLKIITFGKSASIQSKFALNYQFILKMFKNDEVNIDDFMDKSLYSIGHQKEIKQLKNEIDEIKETIQTLPEIEQIHMEMLDEYITINNRLQNTFITLKQKQRKNLIKEQKDIKNKIDDFKNIYDNYKTIYDYKELIHKKEEDIKYINDFVKEDIDKMVRFMYNKEYINNISNKKKCNGCDIEFSDILTVKGYIASEINECNELLLTEILQNKLLHNLEPCEIVGIISAFIEEKDNSFDTQTITDLKVPQIMKDTLNTIGKYACELADEEYNYDIKINTDWNLYLSFIEPAYYWAKGWSIYEIHSKVCHIYDGNFIRSIMRINNICENLKSISEINKDDIMLKKLEMIEKMIIREQVQVDSLYI